MTIKTPLIRQAHQFALMLPVVLGLAAAVLHWGVWFWPERPRIAIALLISAPIINAFALLLPRTWVYVFQHWMWLARVLGWISTRIILVVFFGIVMTPIGLITRILGKRQLDISFGDDRATYWIDKPGQDKSIKRYLRQF